MRPRSNVAVETFCVAFARATDAEIAAYVEYDCPLDRAGSIRAEGPGIAPIERVRGDDPTALIGLPLIRLVAMLRAEGVDVLAPRLPAQ